MDEDETQREREREDDVWRRIRLKRKKKTYDNIVVRFVNKIHIHTAPKSFDCVALVFFELDVQIPYVSVRDNAVHLRIDVQPAPRSLPGQSLE